jgi:rhodanese-related sulfurtransferase
MYPIIVFYKQLINTKMTFSQIFLLFLLFAVLYIVIKRVLLSRNIKTYEPYEVKDKIKDSLNVILLDVRTSAERSRQLIKGSFHIPLQELGLKTAELNKFRNKEIICYCQSGSRSMIAAGKLKKMGFNSANMKGGITKWNFNNI